MPDNITTFANQRVITVNKTSCDKQHPYTTNNLNALDEAASRLQSEAGFKLYIYLAKNQNMYRFALSSKDFMEWSGFKKTAYKTAFQELVEEGYLVAKNSTTYTFYDSSQKQDDDEEVNIEISDGNNKFVF